MFKWLFQGKREKSDIEKAAANKISKEQQEANREHAADLKAKVEYLFNHRTNKNGQPFTFADLEAATASDNDRRQVTVEWLNAVVAGRNGDDGPGYLTGCLGKLYAMSDFFGVPSTWDFWYEDFSEDHKTLIRTVNYYQTGKWQKIYDTESVLLHAGDSTMIPDRNEAALYQEALDNFINSSDFKPTLAANLLRWPENSFLVIGLNTDKTCKILEDKDLSEPPLNFNSDKLTELKYLLKVGWDFEWRSPKVEDSPPVIYLSVSIPEEVQSNQIEQGGPNFVQQVVDDQVNLDWVAEHLHQRFDHLLGLRTPDPSITTHQNTIVLRYCGLQSGVLTEGDLRKIKKGDGHDPKLSNLAHSMFELVERLDKSREKIEIDSNN